MSVTARVAAAAHIGAATFAVCPTATGRSTCEISNLPVGEADELEATVPVQASATPGEQVAFTAGVSAAGASGYSSTSTDLVVLTGTTDPASSLVTLPVPGTLLPIPGTGVSAIDPSTLFPTVGASNTGTGSLDLPSATKPAVLRADTDASAVPLDRQLIGIQMVGLVVLLGAVVIAIVRVSLRTPKTADGVPTGQPKAPGPEAVAKAQPAETLAKAQGAEAAAKEPEQKPS